MRLELPILSFARLWLWMLLKAILTASFYLAKIIVSEVFIKLADIKCRLAFSVKVASFYSAQGQTEWGCTPGGAEKEFLSENLVSEIQNHPPQAQTGRVALDFIILINKIIHFLRPSELSKLNVLKTLYPWAEFLRKFSREIVSEYAQVRFR